MENTMEDEINKKNSIKSSPNYDQQIDEIELLKNIIPEKIEILKEEPNFNIKIEIVGNNTDKPKKTFILIIYLNYYYPEKAPRFKIYEINNYLNERRKNTIEDKLTQFCNENIGLPIIYQLYEICQEFADEEERIELLREEAKRKSMIPFQLNNLKKIKEIKEIPLDIILLKNGYILTINIDNIIKIYDKKFKSIVLEQLKGYTYLDFNFCKYFPSSNQKDPDYLYLFHQKTVYIYLIIYFNKKQIFEKYDLKVNGNAKIKFLTFLEQMNDVIEFPEYKNSIFFISNEETKYLLYKYNKIKNEDNNINIKFEKNIIYNSSEKKYRRLYKINSDKFIIASYTLKYRAENNNNDNNNNEDIFKIEGINKMSFVDRKDFIITKSFNIKISPLNYSIVNYKKDYILVSYFKTFKKDNDDSKAIKYYDFEDNKYINIFHHIEENYNDYYDDFYNDNDNYNYNYIYNNNNNNNNSDYNKHSYYSYDICDHLIGLFNIKTEELVTIIEFDLIKRIYNINDKILSIFSKNKKDSISNQISIERIFHDFYNDDSLNESYLAEKYKRENYTAFLLFDEEFKIVQCNIDYSNITAMIEIENGYLAICSKKKGIILYNNK